MNCTSFTAGTQEALEGMHAKLDALIVAQHYPIYPTYPINTEAPFYSHYLAWTMNMTTPYEQDMFWIATISGCVAAVYQVGKGVRHPSRARELGRAFASKRQNKPDAEVQLHLANAEAHENQLLRVEAFERQQRGTAATRFVVAATSSLLWAAYVNYRRTHMLHDAAQQRQQQPKQPQQQTKGMLKS